MKTNGMKSMKKPEMAKKAIAMGTLMMLLLVPGISAYFTDGDTATNTFTTGDVHIDLQEADWVPPTNITPEQEFDKTPRIFNDGTNDAFTFMTVEVPCADVVTADEDGSRNAEADTQLFSWMINQGWVQVGEVEKDETKQTHTYVYGYGSNTALTPVKSGETTGALFDHVEFANLVEDEDMENKSLHIVIKGYAIQTTNINDGANDTLTGENKDGKCAPADVWKVLEKQAPSTVVAANEDVNTDIKK